MSTLTEIEAAADHLPPPQIEQLIAHLTARLREAQARPARDLSSFAGVVRLDEDPLAWQREVRGEWR